MKPEFVHLHVHSQYSLLDALNRFDPLAVAAKKRGMKAIALTDHGNLFGAIEFYRAAWAHQIKPIIGCEVYVAAGSRHEREVRQDGRERGYHLTLLATSSDGYRNLAKLSSLGYTEGFYYNPRVDNELLDAHSEGLVALSGCLSAEVARRFLAGDEAGSLGVMRRYRDIFGPKNFFLELQDHGIADQAKLVQFLLDRSQADGIPTVATNDVHYLDHADAGLHDALLCVGTRSLLREPKRKRYDSDQFYLKSPEEMARLFSFDPDAVKRTVEIAERCDLDLAFGKHHLPSYPIPIGAGDENAYLSQLAEQGLASRVANVAPAYRERLALELDVIRKKGFAGYFLIVSDFMAEARRRGIPVGPGRGSSAGSLVAFALGITEIDPLRHGLLFERFLNPERSALPDIDVDICQIRREEVIEYVKQRYGADRVAQIITFGTFGAKAVLRDACRIHDMRIPETEAIVRLVPDQIKITLSEAMEKVAELKEAGTGPNAELFKTALGLEGLVRHASRHAAGIVIANVPITEVAPLYKDADGHVMTQYDMTAVESLGLLKIDILGLKTLSVIEKAERMIAASPEGAEKLKARDLDALDDPAVYRLIASGHALGIFQLDSAGIRDLLLKVKPSRFEDVVAVIALYRPGPMQLADEFISRKHGRTEVEYLHASLEPILEPTYGIILYQEQVMEIAHRIGGFSLAEADNLRKAMGKKNPEMMASYRAKFVEGAAERGFKKPVAEKLWEQMERFAGYGFNKSHAVAYAVILYRTAWLKAHEPTAFMAAALSFEYDNHDKLAVYLEECRRMGIKLLPPDVARSETLFSPEGEKAIRYGLAAVRNVGVSACEAIFEARASSPFISFWDFLLRVDRKRLNRRALDALVLVGALDALGSNRRSLVEALPEFWDRAAGAIRDAESAQASLFEEKALEPTVRKVAEFDDLSAWEMEYLGTYLTLHPLVRKFPAARILATPADKPGVATWRVGRLSDFQPMLDKRGNEMARGRCDAMQGKCGLLIFSSVFKKHKALLKEGAVVFVKGKLEASGQMIADEIADAATVRWRARVVIDAAADEKQLRRVQDALERVTEGTCPVEIELTQEGKAVRLRSPRKVDPASLSAAFEEMAFARPILMPA